MNNLIITDIVYKGKNKIFCGIHNSRRFYQLNFSERECEAGNVGDIFVGRVKNIVKNINAAFIEYKKGFVGYFSIEDNKNIVFLNNKNTDKLCEGDLIIVQLEKAAIKTKFPVLTSCISMAGRNIILNIGKQGIGFSGKIKNNEFKTVINEHIGKYPGIYKSVTNDMQYENIGVIIRTNAINVDVQDLVNELKSLICEWNNIRNMAKTRQCYTVLKKSDALYLNYIKGAYKNEISEIITDNENIYEEIRRYIKDIKCDEQNSINVKLYKDDLLPLHKLYSIDKTIENIFDKKVWLKSGAYLIIEPTEAMTVIDVNTGKNIKGKNVDSAILNVNKEAAKEIAYQLRFRNLSGIIMIDFINMKQEQDRKELLDYLKQCVTEDRIKTTVVDMTKLELVELTRKKVESPVFQQLL